MQRLLASFNKLGRRERFGIIAALVALVYMVMDVSVVAPAEKRLKAVKADVAKADAEIKALRDEMVVVKAQLDRDPFAKDRAQLDAYKKAIETATAFLAKVNSDPRQVGVVLRQLIGSTPGVSLVSLKTLPVVALSETKGAPSPKVGPAKTIYRRGIEVVIRGNYLALLPYLEKLQNMPTRVLWTDASLDVIGYPDSTFRFMIYTLSAEPGASIG